MARNAATQRAAWVALKAQNHFGTVPQPLMSTTVDIRAMGGLVSFSERVLARFKDLAAACQGIPVTSDSSGGQWVDNESFQRWASSAMHLVKSVFGEESPHYENLTKAYNAYVGYPENLAAMRGIFLAAKSDYEGGFLFRVEATLAGEIFADFVVAAKAALAENQKDVAAVLACAALEDALKRFARLNGLDVDDKDMQQVINALKAGGLVSGPQRSLLDTMPKIRDAAMHANWGKITPQDVGSVIGFVEQFLLTQFQ